MKYNRYLPLFIPLMIWILFQVVLYYPTLIYVVMSFSLLLVFFSMWQFTRASQIDKAWWNFLILPAMFTLVVLIYATLQNKNWFIQSLFFVNLVVQYLYFRFCYYYLINPSAYKISSIENLSIFGNFVLFFLASSAMYGFQAALNAPSWLLLVGMVVLSAVVVYQVFWANKIKVKENLIYLLVSVLALVELGWAISFLPLNYNIAGFTLAIFYYIIVGLIRMEFADNLGKDRVKLYLAFGFGSILLILLTARWF